MFPPIIPRGEYKSGLKLEVIKDWTLYLILLVFSFLSFGSDFSDLNISELTLILTLTIVEPEPL